MPAVEVLHVAELLARAYAAGNPLPTAGATSVSAALR
jgi:hypothetical protein